MKTKLVSRIIFTCLLLIIAIFFNGCSKNDDTPIDSVSCGTFLECNDATKWEQVFLEDGIESARIYLRLNNNLNNPLENWLKFTPNDCHNYMQISDHQFEIIENSKDKFAIKIVWQYDDWQQDEFEIWTFTKQGESLKLVTQYFQEIIAYNLNSTSASFNNLEICNN